MRTALMRAEARKMWTTRSYVAIAAATVAYPALTVLAVALAPDAPTVGRDTILQIVRGAAELATVSALTIGILAMAGEYRHGTIVPTLLVAPRRQRLVGAKLVTLAVAGAGLSLAASATGLVVGGAYLGGRGVGVNVLSGDVVVTVAGAVLVASLYAAVGVGVGAVVKNQTAAVAGALAWVLTVERVLPVVLHEPRLRNWLPGGAADRLLHLADTGAAWGALGMLVGVVAALALAAVAATRTADVH